MNAVVRTFRQRCGISILYVVIIMAVVFAFASLALDYGRVQLSKTQLQIACDTAAKHSVAYVSGGASKVLAKANETSSDNKVNAAAIVYAAAEVKVGNWDYQNRLFKAGQRPQNAVEIKRTETIPLALGHMIGRDTSRVRGKAVAVCVPMGIVGFNGITFKNNTFVGSYDSAVRTNPTPGTSNDNGTLASNAYIGEMHNGNIHGDVYTGPSGSVDPGFTITGGTTKAGSALSAPADPSWSPGTNPGGKPQVYTHNSATPLPGGSYWFTDLKVTAQMRFSAPATIYVNGNIDASANITAYNSIPANLTIYQIGAGRKFDANGVSLTAKVVAPRSDFTATNNFNFYGAMMFNTILLKNNASLFYDETLGSVGSVSVVQ